MPAIKLKDGVYSVGVLNPNMRIFDVIMKTEFGTSYNAFLVRGEKTALIDTVHGRFFDEYLDNVRSVCDLSEIDYVVMNHNEPDHSGALARLFAEAPQIQVVSSKAGCLYLKHITNAPELPLRAVKDGDTLDLGGKTLHFVSAPFLHWPDSMFSWLPEDGIAFTCDFPGTHYCEPRMLDTSVSYPKYYESAFRGYYDAIFSPFKPYVLEGLKKLRALDPEMVCVSHGPVLTRGCRLAWALDNYEKWSTPEPHENPRIPIFYCSAYGNTGLLAGEIAEGIRAKLPEAEVEAFDINESDPAGLAARINEADAFLLGSPTLNKDAVAPVWHVVSCIDAINSKGRPAGVFGSFGWSGEAVPMLERLRALKLNVFEDGFTCRFVPSEAEMAAARDFGERFAATLTPGR